ncbi:MBG domain-containing protein, partial [Pseudomonas aeruginosa]
GDADPSLTYQVSGLKNGDTAGAVLNSGSLSRVAGENVGV